MTKPTWHPRKQLLFAALSAADFGLTWWLIDRSGGLAYEANPVANWCLTQAGWLGLAGFKAAVVALVLGIAAAVSRRRPQAAAGVLWLGCACLVAVVGYSTALAATAPPALVFDANGYGTTPEIDEVNRQTAQDRRLKATFRTLLEELRLEVTAGRISLAAAADKLASCGGARDPYWMKIVTAPHPGRPLRERFAYYLLCRAVWSAEVTPSAVWAVADRLEREFQTEFGVSAPLRHRDELLSRMESNPPGASSERGHSRRGKRGHDPARSRGRTVETGGKQITDLR